MKTRKSREAYKEPALLTKTNNMYSKTNPKKSLLKRNKDYEGETIEMKVRRIMSNKEPIKDGAPLIYTERKDGVQPEYDPRTDRFEAALDAMDYTSKSHRAKRENRIAEEAKKNMEIENKDTGDPKSNVAPGDKK